MFNSLTEKNFNRWILKRGNVEWWISNAEFRTDVIRYSAVHHSTFKKAGLGQGTGFRAQGAGRECVIWQERKWWIMKRWECRMMNIKRWISNRVNVEWWISNAEFRTDSHSTFDILRFIIRHLKKTGLGQGAGFRAQGVNVWFGKKGNDEWWISNVEFRTDVIRYSIFCGSSFDI